MRWGWKEVMMGYHCGNVDGVVFAKGGLKYYSERMPKQANRAKYKR